MVNTASRNYRERLSYNREQNGREPIMIRTVGVIGAGQMGNGIAHVVALGGYDVLLHDISRERVEEPRGPGAIELLCK